jgi:hypothetical protein
MHTKRISRHELSKSHTTTQRYIKPGSANGRSGGAARPGCAEGGKAMIGLAFSTVAVGRLSEVYFDLS